MSHGFFTYRFASEEKASKARRLKRGANVQICEGDNIRGSANSPLCALLTSALVVSACVCSANVRSVAAR